MRINPLILDGQNISLIPLSLDHLNALCDVGLDEELWRLSSVHVRAAADMQAYIEDALDSQKNGMALPFVTVERASGKIVGSTRYGNIALEHRRLEIGWTWIARPWQRTAVNTEAKYLMLQYAFETLHCQRIEIKTDVLNEKSRQAILRLGATEEGVLRKHMITSRGRVRDTIYFSILDTEWADVKARLEAKLNRS